MGGSPRAASYFEEQTPPATLTPALGMGQLLGPHARLLAQPCHLHMQLEWSQHGVAEVTSQLPP